MPAVSLAPWQMAAVYNPYTHFAMYAGVACVAANTLIETANGPREISKLQENDLVVSVGKQGLVLVPCEKPFVKGRARLLRIEHERGSFVVHERHLLASFDRSYQYAADLSVGDVLCSFFSNPKTSSEEFVQKEFPSNVQNSSETPLDLKDDCFASNRRCDLLPGFWIKQPHSQAHKSIDEHISAQFLDSSDASGQIAKHSHPDQYAHHFCKHDSLIHEANFSVIAEGLHGVKPPEQILPNSLSMPLFQKKSDCHPLSLEWAGDHEPASFPLSCARAYSLCYSRILSITVLNEEQEFWDVHIPGTENYLAEGAVHHNCGKTFSGSQFAVFHFINHPEKTGLIAANNHDQLSQATLRELFYWLDAYGLEYVVDRIPPTHWGEQKKFKTYRNILSVRNPRNSKVAYAFIRILSDPDALRGIEISWYWLDEARDTPEDTHDVVVSRMRESDYMKGIITTTTNGEDWSYRKFVKGARKNDFLFGSMHVRSIESVRTGIITQAYYDSMERSYSPLKAAQELDAQHVNLYGGRAYYCAGPHNQRHRAPWGDEWPNRERPLIIGCDFNFSPAPCIWEVGQCGPDLFGPNGEYYGAMIHWFGEIAEAEMSSAGMTRILVNRYPDFHYRMYGDCSGGVGTTSNAGVTDYDHMALVFQEMGCMYSIDYFQSDEAQNPRVKNRVENMNRLLKNAVGEVAMTYNPNSCPHLHDDMKIVGWRTQTNSGRGKLSDGGDYLRTHASDAAGYAAFKVLPPNGNFRLAPSVPSPVRSEYGLIDQRQY